MCGKVHSLFPWFGHGNKECTGCLDCIFSLKANFYGLKTIKVKRQRIR